MKKFLSLFIVFLLLSCVLTPKEIIWDETLQEDVMTTITIPWDYKTMWHITEYNGISVDWSMFSREWSGPILLRLPAGRTEFRAIIQRSIPGGFAFLPNLIISYNFLAGDRKSVV